MTTTTLNPSQQVLSVVPEADRAIVGLHTNLLMNTTPGIRPSDAARRAVAEYERLGVHEFTIRHYADRDAALRACPCGACQADTAKLEG